MQNQETKPRAHWVYSEDKQDTTYNRSSPRCSFQRRTEGTSYCDEGIKSENSCTNASYTQTNEKELEKEEYKRTRKEPSQTENTPTKQKFSIC